MVPKSKPRAKASNIPRGTWSSRAGACPSGLSFHLTSRLWELSLTLQYQELRHRHRAGSALSLLDSPCPWLLNPIFCKMEKSQHCRHYPSHQGSIFGQLRLRGRLSLLCPDQEVTSFDSCHKLLKGEMALADRERRGCLPPNSHLVMEA